jgi:uncharacterized protein YcfJ
MRTLGFRLIGLLGAIVAATAGFGCSTMNNTEKDAIAGGAVGTAVGAAVGSTTGHTGTGAAVGGLAGTAAGALIGNEADKKEKRKREAAEAAALAAAKAREQQIGVIDVITMVKDGHSDQVIINQIRTTHSTFQLAVSDLNLLKANGVSEVVIAEMQAARPAPPAPRKPGH